MRAELQKAAELLRQRDADKFEEVLRLLQDTVYSFSLKVCGHREDAEDTTQDVLMKIMPRLETLESPDALAVWLYKITRNRCWEGRRKSKFAPRQMLTLEELLPDGQELAALATRPHLGPEGRAIARQESLRVAELVRQLPAKYRMVLVLHDMEDLTTEQVAKVLELREATVRVRLHRGRLFVRKGLARQPQPAAAGARKTPRKRGPRRARDGKCGPPCQEIFRGLSDYMDHEAREDVCERMQRHMEDCPQCFQFMRDLTRVVSACRAQTVPCPPEVHEKVRRHLMEEWRHWTRNKDNARATVGRP
jgi:RNA polymerase sigma-70 factor (ECF subfamily)